MRAGPVDEFAGNFLHGVCIAHIGNKAMRVQATGGFLKRLHPAAAQAQHGALLPVMPRQRRAKATGGAGNEDDRWFSCFGQDFLLGFPAAALLARAFDQLVQHLEQALLGDGLGHRGEVLAVDQQGGYAINACIA